MPRSTPWTGITDNKILTHQDLKQAVDDGYLDSKKVINLDLTQAVTKDRAIEYLNIDNDIISQRGVYYKDGNQLITKFYTRRPCNQCTPYNLFITQEDINASQNGFVLYTYYPCGAYTGDTVSVQFANPGTYSDYMCVQSCADSEPIVQIFNGEDYIPATNGSSIIQMPGNCLKTIVDCGTSGATFTYYITNPGYTYIDTYVDLGTTGGNVFPIISATTTNTVNEIFMGNYVESIGEIFTYSTGTFSVTGNTPVGFFSSTNKTTLDIVVYSTNSGPFTPYYITFTIPCPITFSCQSDTSPTVTYVTGSTYTVATAGFVKYRTETDTIYKYSYVGVTNVISECHIFESIMEGVPLINITSPLNIQMGSPCGNVSNTLGEIVYITFSANQGFSATAYWLDSNGTTQTRFIYIGETFTTCGQNGSGTGLPVSYGGLCSTPTTGGTIEIVNTSLEVIVNGVSVNEVPIIGGTFPDRSGENTFGISDQIGTYDLTVYYSNLITGQSILLTDSDLNNYCIAIPSIGTNQITFPGVTINSTTSLQITLQDGICY